ncbi:MAG: hypothetical protein IH585_19275 [Anaerolineaceae bacterium]|nr:hypothetical protein [Anaerolineaceae bacterium]
MHAATDQCNVAIECDVGQRRAGSHIGNSPANSIGDIIKEDNIDQLGAAGVVVHAAADRRRVIRKGDVVQPGGAGIKIGHASTALGICAVASKRDSHQSGVAAKVVHHSSTVVTCGVAGEGHFLQGWAVAIVRIHSTPIYGRVLVKLDIFQDERLLSAATEHPAASNRPVFLKAYVSNHQVAIIGV